METTRRMLKCFFMLIALLSNYLSPVLGNTKVASGWEVYIILKPNFPAGLSSNLDINLVYPTPEKVRVDVMQENHMYWSAVKMEDWDKIEYRLSITPRSGSVEPPTYVQLRVSGFGFQETTRNTGVLRYERARTLWAKSTVDVDMRPENLPRVVNAVRLADMNKQFVTYEVTISNPNDRPVSITEVIINNQANWPSTCAGGEVYEVKLRVEGKIVTGYAKKNEGTRRKVYPVIKGEHSGSCGVDTITARIPISQDIPAKQNAYLAFRINIEPHLKKNNPFYDTGKSAREFLKLFSEETIKEGAKLRWRLDFIIDRELTASTGILYINDGK